MDSTASDRTHDGSCHRLPVRQLPAPRRVVADDATARLLLAGSPRQVLAHIVPGDPLGLRVRCADRLRERAQFADVDRVLVWAQARIAREAPRRRGRPGLGDWILERIDEALSDVFDGASLEGTSCDGTSCDGTSVAPPEPGSVLALLSEPLGLSPLEMARSCARFNALDSATRRAFYALVIDGLALERATVQLARPALEIARMARTGLDAFRIAAAPMVRASASPAAQKSSLEARLAPPFASTAGSTHGAEVHQDLHLEEDQS